MSAWSRFVRWWRGDVPAILSPSEARVSLGLPPDVPTFKGAPEASADPTLLEIRDELRAIRAELRNPVPI